MPTLCIQPQLLPPARSQTASKLVLLHRHNAIGKDPETTNKHNTATLEESLDLANGTMGQTGKIQTAENKLVLRQQNFTEREGGWD